MTGLLADITVVEIGTGLTGPFAAKILADMGAEVMKVENPMRNDSLRFAKFPADEETHGSDTFTWRFLPFNTNKRSIVLDAKTEEGGEILEALIANADVLMENMRPGAMERLGFGWTRLQDLNPELVYCSIKGFADDGPYADWPAQDTILQGITGLAYQVGEGEEPGVLQVNIADMMTSFYAAMTVCGALYEREDEGEGQRIDINMLNVAVSVLGVQLGQHSAKLHDDSVEQAIRLPIAPNGFFETANGDLTLLIAGEYLWEGLCEVLGVPEWADDDHRYGTNEGRVAAGNRLRADLEEILRQRTTEEWLEAIHARPESIPAGPVNDVSEMVADPQVRAQSAVAEANHPILGRYVAPTVPYDFSRSETVQEPIPAPGFGEDSDAILTELGYSTAKRKALRDQGVVEQPTE